LARIVSRTHLPPRSHEAQAWVLGVIDLVRALKLAEIPVVVIAERQDPARHSRSAVARLDAGPPEQPPEARIGALLTLAADQAQAPVLYYDDDATLLFVSRNRDRLARGFRFAIPAADLVEDLVDKARFHALAERLGLPVPRTVRCSSQALDDDHGLRFPLVVKPVSRHGGAWARVEDGKAAHVQDRSALAALGARLADASIDLLVQEVVPGPESRVVSYHVYVDEQGRVAGEFTGRKLRTYPRSYGFSTAITITDDAELRALGRRITLGLELRGVAKLDFKRGPDGTPKLLEVNPRFNLWHHAGALAGVNLPALVYDRLLGRPAAPPRAARPGVTWCSSHDLRAARAAGLGIVPWLRWVAGCDAISGLAWDDPFPLPLAAAWRARGRLRRGAAA
jgi:D-aspartate ligase